MRNSPEPNYHDDYNNKLDKNRYSSLESGEHSNNSPNERYRNKNASYSSYKESNYASGRNHNHSNNVGNGSSYATAPGADSNDDNTRIYIENVSNSVERRDLYDLYDPIGKVLDVYVSPKSPHFALITFNTYAECIKAIQKTNDTKFHGLYLKVSHAHPRKSSARVYCTNCRNYGHSSTRCPDDSRYESFRKSDKFERSLSRSRSRSFTPRPRSMSRHSRSRSRSSTRSRDRMDAKRRQRSHSRDRIHVSRPRVMPPRTPPSDDNEKRNNRNSMSASKQHLRTPPSNRSPIMKDDENQAISPELYKSPNNDPKSVSDIYNKEIYQNSDVEIDSQPPSKVSNFKSRGKNPYQVSSNNDHGANVGSKTKKILIIDQCIQVSRTPLMINQCIQTDPVVILDKKFAKKSSGSEIELKKAKYDKTSGENLKNRISAREASRNQPSYY